MENRVFFPQAALDQWLVDGKVDLQSAELTILDEGRKYAISEAIHVKAEVTGADDANELVGRVKSRRALEQLGAEIFETSMILGDLAYDVAPGWFGSPLGSFADYVLSGGLKHAPRAHLPSELAASFSVEPSVEGVEGAARGPSEPRTDEDVLARFLTENL